MLIIPAIDLRLGKCVRLVRGLPEQETIYSEDPVKMACSWEEQGAQWLHVVDLDGAFTGSPQNVDVVEKIVEAVDIPVQVGGGIRDLDYIDRLLDFGVARVIVGTIAIIKPELVEEACRLYGEAIVVGIDAKKGQVAIEGWGVTTEKSAVELAREMSKMGVKRVVFTDVKRDGTLTGPNVQATKELARATGLKVIASGGVSSAKDLKALKAIEHEGVEAVIVGKALYSGNITLEEAMAIAGG